MNKVIIISSVLSLMIVIGIVVFVVIEKKKNLKQFTTPNATTSSVTTTPTTPGATTIPSTTAPSISVPSTTTSTPTNIQLPSGLANGQVVRCDADGAVYKIENYKLRHYTSAGYAADGSPAYANVDCSTLYNTFPKGIDILGPVLPISVINGISSPQIQITTPTQGKLANGQVVRCDSDGSIYKIENNTLRHFTPSGYAAAGNPAYTNVDCSTLYKIPQGSDIDAPTVVSPVQQSLLPNGLTNNQVVRCDSDGAIYKIDNNTLRHYTPTGYAANGSPPYTNFDCSTLYKIPRGSDIDASVVAPVASSLPSGLTNNQVVRCDADGAIYKIDNNTLRHYTPAGYNAAGGPAYQNVDCSTLNKIPRGSDIDALVSATQLPNGLTNNQVVRCDADGAIYKIDNNTLRHYTPAGYAANGSPQYTNASCSILNAISKGSDITTAEAQSIQ